MKKHTIAFALMFILAGSALLSGCTNDTVQTGNFSFDSDGNTVLQPPPTGEGFQVQIPAFDVAVGSEVQRDYYITLPNDEDYEVAKIEIAMNDGTHHMNLFRTTLSDTGILAAQKRTGRVRYINNGKDSMQDVSYYDSSFYASSIFNESDILIEAQTAGKLYSWDLAKLPNGKQSTIHLKPHERMILQFHYVNATTQQTKNGKGKISVNIWKNKNTAGGTETSSMLFARNRKIHILPNSDTIFYKDCKFIVVPRPFYILGMTGHFHSRGRNFDVDKMRDSSGVGVFVETIYSSIAWDEPPFKPFDTPVQINAGEYIRYKCRYVNTSGNHYLFGPNVETNEHMNLFAWFAPSWNNGQTVYDTDL